MSINGVELTFRYSSVVVRTICSTTREGLGVGKTPVTQIMNAVNGEDVLTCRGAWRPLVATSRT